jgi:alpha-beta hydrolase superfamily lysophospholipase
VPLCVQIPGADRLVDADVTEAFACRAPAGLVEVHRYPELFHELFIDKDCEAVVSDATAWLSARCEGL